jgi:polar amino acid transport system permease protein
MHVTSLSIYDSLMLLKGASWTLFLCVLSLLLGSLLAVLVGVFRSRQTRFVPLTFLQWLLAGYVELIRGTPLLLQLIFVFFGLSLVRINLSPFQAALLCLSSYTAAYGSEIVRAGIGSVAQAQYQAALSLGLTPLKTMRYVVLPQAFKVIIPPAVGLFVGLIKDSSLVAVVGFIELTRAGRIIVERTNLAIVVFPIIAAIYFLICYPLSRFAKHVEIKLRSSEREA